LYFKMFQRDNNDQVYEYYNEDYNRFSECTAGFYEGIKNIFNKIKNYRFKKVKPSNKHLSKLLLGDDYYNEWLNEWLK